jgi:hypothetical protein
MATVEDQEYPWAPRHGYNEILPYTPLTQRLHSLARLTKQPWGQDSFVEKEHLVNWNGMPTFFSSIDPMDESYGVYQARGFTIPALKQLPKHPLNHNFLNSKCQLLLHLHS